MSNSVSYTGNITDDHAAALVKDMRVPEKQDLLRHFGSVEEGLRYCWDSSKFRRVVLLGDEAVAVFGLADDAGVQVPWLLMTCMALSENPIRIMREARRTLRAVADAFPGPMLNYVPVDDVQAHSMIEVLGFELRREFTVERAGHPYYAFWMEAA